MREARYCFDFDVWSTDSFRLIEWISVFVSVWGLILEPFSVTEWNSVFVSVWGLVLGSFGVSERSLVLF